MAVTFPHPINIFNQTPQKGAINPHELHNFEYNHFAVPDGGTCITGYSLSGDIPLDLSVDGAGVISGKIRHFGEQPSTQDNKPDMIVELDGTNWDENGRYKNQYYDFEFTITCDWMGQAGPSPCSVPGSTSQKCIIREVKDHNIDNLIYIQNYLDKGPDSHSINVDGIQYFDHESARAVMPGPFQDI